MSTKNASTYDLLEIPGLDNLKIAVIPIMKHPEEYEDTGSRFYEWTIAMDLLFSPNLAIELYGWYAESSRNTGTDVGNQLFTSASIQHSELIIVISCGKHLADLENKLANGTPITAVIITRWIKLNGIQVPIQVNTFQKCYITAIQQYLDYLIVRMRIYSKNVVCTAFDQHGTPSGVGMCNVNFSTEKISF